MIITHKRPGCLDNLLLASFIFYGCDVSALLDLVEFIDGLRCRINIDFLLSRNDPIKRLVLQFLNFTLGDESVGSTIAMVGSMGGGSQRLVYK